MTDSSPCSKALKKAVLLALLAATVMPVSGQTPAIVLPGPRETIRSFSGGFGTASARDTYLSMSTYSGYTVSYEENSWVGYAPDQLFGYGRHHWSVLFSPMENPVGGGSTYQFMWNYNYSRVWNAVHTNASDLLVGPAGMTKLGCLYNQMNSNNPVNLEGYVSAGFCVDYTWRFKIKRHGFALQGTVYSPLAGIAFAPDYDQPYWYMYNYNQYDRAVHFAWVGNCFAFTEQIALVCPLWGGRVRVGYTLDYMGDRLGGHLTSLYDNQLTVGFIYRFELKKWNL